MRWLRRETTQPGILLFLGLFWLCFPSVLAAGGTQVLRGAGFEVFYDGDLKDAAEDILDIYPILEADLYDLFTWRPPGRPRIVLTTDRDRFQRMAANRFSVAFAVPSRNLVVIDGSRALRRPFSLETILKHELCHLLLHSKIADRYLPKWLDEGVCQWASDGMADIIMVQERSMLRKAALGGQPIRLRDLERSFPAEGEAIQLAYEASRSMVEYIVVEFGKEALLAVLHELQRGGQTDAAVSQVIGISFNQIHEDWYQSLRGKLSWLSYLSYHLYGILFGLAAITAMVGFIRVMLQKRAYLKQDTEKEN